jgi:hypothetical protein
MLTLGSASQTGYMNNAGAVTFCADPFLAAGTYSPITEYAGRAMTWSGTGTYNALGGTWKNTAKTFIVVGPTALAAGVVRGVSSGERVLVTDSFSGQRVGASFGTVNTGVTFSAACTPAAELASLTPTAGEALLSAWDFTANFTSGSSLLAFDVGRGVTDVNVWHCDGSTWTLLDPVDLIYSSGGIVSFTASVFGDYAIVGGHTLAGDANGDGKVSFADYLVLESNFGKSGTTWAQGDFNNDAKVSFADYVLLESNFDKSVPEPLTVALLLVGGLGIRRRG